METISGESRDPRERVKEILPVTLSEAHCGCRLESRADKPVSKLPVGWMEKHGHQSYLRALLQFPITMMLREQLSQSRPPH